LLLAQLTILQDLNAPVRASTMPTGYFFKMPETTDADILVVQAALANAGRSYRWLGVHNAIFI